MLHFEPAEECKDGEPQHIAGTAGQAGETSLQSSAPASAGGGALLLRLRPPPAEIVSLWLWARQKLCLTHLGEFMTMYSNGEVKIRTKGLSFVWNIPSGIINS